MLTSIRRSLIATALLVIGLIPSPAIAQFVPSTQAAPDVPPPLSPEGDPDWERPVPTGHVVSPPDFQSSPWIAPYSEFDAFRSEAGFPSSPELYDQLSKTDPVNWLFGVALTAEERSRLEARSLASDRHDAVLAALHGVKGFAGSVLEGSADNLTLTVLGTSDFAADRRVEELSGASTGSGFRLKVVDYSLAELQLQRDAILLDQANQRRSWLVASVSVDYAGNELNVDIVFPGSSAQAHPVEPARDTLRLLAPALGAVVVEDSLPRDHSLCTTERCLPTSSGVGWGLAGISNTCTSGFTLRRSDTGNLYHSSAGHCAGVGQSAAMGDSLPQVALGNVAYSYNNNGGIGDFLAIDVPDVIATNDHRMSWSEWGAGWPVTGVENQWQLSQNEAYCVKGLVSSGCGTIVSSSTSGCFAVNWLGQCTFWTHDLIEGTWTGTNGDSGAGAYLQSAPHMAVGLLKGSGYYSTVDNVTAMHSFMQVYLTSNPARDWIVPIYIHGLLRNPDSGGLNYWAGYLATSCGLTRARDVYYNMMLGSEMINSINFASSSQISEGIRRLYRAGLGRTPAQSEVNSWLSHVTATSNLAQRQARFADIVYSITFSSEFSSRVVQGSQGDRPTCSQ